ncbi:hypothetical protein V6N11_057510 [Hibiscus sabdariffa]|uniref:Uncharacterized protein n=1 Tax=Hibiscus sabdariffa TaxID=183260 RepID=A0ABR2NGY1_9ROSI
MFDTPRGISDEDWPTRFIILCWLIWKRRCSFVLASEVRHLEDILAKGNRLVEECRRAFYRQAEPPIVFPVAPNDVRSLIEDDRVQSDSMRLPLVRAGAAPFDPGEN